MWTHQKLLLDYNSQDWLVLSMWLQQQFSWANCFSGDLTVQGRETTLPISTGLLKELSARWNTASTVDPYLKMLVGPALLSKKQIPSTQPDWEGPSPFGPGPKCCFYANGMPCQANGCTWLFLPTTVCISTKWWYGDTDGMHAISLKHASEKFSQNVETRFSKRPEACLFFTFENRRVFSLT